MQIALTGEMDRIAVKQWIAANGHTVINSAYHADMLIIGANPGSKLAVALGRGIPVKEATLCHGMN